MFFKSLVLEGVKFGATCPLTLRSSMRLCEGDAALWAVLLLLHRMLTHSNILCYRVELNSGVC